MIKLTENELTDALIEKWFSMKRKTLKVKCIKNMRIPGDKMDFTKDSIYVMRKSDETPPEEAYVTNDQDQRHWIYSINDLNEPFFHKYFRIVNV